MKTVNKIKGWIGKLIPYVFGILLAAGLVLFLTYGKYDISEMEEADALNVLLMLALVTVTLFYAKAAKETADAAKQQADASVRMVEMASRPMMIQKAIHQGMHSGGTLLGPQYFQHFLLINVGSGPAIEVEISLLDEQKREKASLRKTFLRSGEEEIVSSRDDKWLRLSELEEGRQYYLVCEYQDIFGIYHQTWLPFKVSEASKESQIYVSAGELEFKYNIPQEERIDAFVSRSKPK